MIDFLLAEGNTPFLAAAMFVALLALLEAVLVALGLSSDAVLGHGDAADAGEVGAAGIADAGGDASGFLGGALSWLGFGRVPLAVLLICLATAFSGAGFVLQAVADALVGHHLPWQAAAAIAILPALPLTRMTTTAVARLVPREETYAVTLSSLVGRIGLVTQGEATTELAAEARVPDGHGGSLHVRVFPEPGALPIPQGARVVLVRRISGDAFEAQATDATASIPNRPDV